VVKVQQTEKTARAVVICIVCEFSDCAVVLRVYCFAALYPPTGCQVFIQLLYDAGCPVIEVGSF
jgi:hypothetical protein